MLKLGAVSAINIINIIDKIDNCLNRFLPILIAAPAGFLPGIETMVTVAEPV